MADAEGSNRPVPDVAATGESSAELLEKVVMGGQIRGILRRVVERHAGVVTLDGLRLSRYVRWFEDASGTWGAAAYGHDRDWATHVVVFEGDPALGTPLLRSGGPMLRAEVGGAFCSYETRSSLPLMRSDGRRVWSLRFELQPLAPRGIDQIAATPPGGPTTILRPSEDDVWDSFELVDLLRHGNPEFVQLEFGDPTLTTLPEGVTDAVVAIEVPELEPTSETAEGIRSVAADWATTWRSLQGLALRPDPSDPMRVFGPGGLEFVVSTHHLSALLTPVIRACNKRAVVRVFGPPSP